MFRAFVEKPPKAEKWSNLSSSHGRIEIQYLSFSQTNADGETGSTAAVAAAAAAGATPTAVGFPHSDVHFPIKKEFGTSFMVSQIYF